MNPNSQKFIWGTQCCVAALVVVLFAGCSSAQPSASDGERVILDRIKSESEGRIKLVSFKKTNGQKREMMGAEYYGMEYEIEIEFTEDCKWVKGIMGQQGFRTMKSVVSPNGSRSYEQLLADTQAGDMVKQGQREKLSGTLVFEKTENGWRPAKM